MAVWLVAVAIFVVFLSINAYAGIIGYSECGCFGPLKVNPWLTAVLDVVFIFLLVFARPKYIYFNPIKSFVSLIILLVLALAIIFFVNGPIGDHVVSYLRGNKVYLVPTLSDFGSGLQGVTKTFRVKIVNRLDSPVRLVGGTSGCNCTVLKNLPLNLPANAQKEVEIEVILKGQPGLLDLKYQIFTNLKSDSKIVGVVKGKISEANSP